MYNQDEVIEELVELILMQHDEIRKLEKKIEQIKQYIAVYEDYIKRGDY
jgi:predicted small metal-binding protein